MGKVVNLQANTPKTRLETAKDIFAKEVEKDIQKLTDATGLDRDDAITLAKDFYRKYTALMEYVSDLEQILKKD